MEQMVELEVSIRSVEATKTTESANQDTQASFSVNASITEGNRAPGEVVLRFSMELSTQPDIARLLVNGSARITGGDDEVDALLAAKEEGGTPVVFMRIYQRVYAVLYLICGSLRVPYPSPGLLKSVRVSSAQNIAEPVGGSQKGAISV